MSLDVDDQDDGALFGVPELAIANPAKLGRVEAALLRSAEAATAAGTLVAEDGGLLAGALVAARALDSAERAAGFTAGTKAGYLVAQLLTPYRETLQALRLPAALAPAEAPAPAPAGDGGVPSWLGDAFGTPE